MEHCAICYINGVCIEVRRGIPDPLYVAENCIVCSRRAAGFSERFYHQRKPALKMNVRAIIEGWTITKVTIYCNGFLDVMDF